MKKQSVSLKIEGQSVVQARDHRFLKQAASTTAPVSFIVDYIHYLLLFVSTTFHLYKTIILTRKRITSRQNITRL